MRLLQINVTANSGSTGRIAEGIGNAAQTAGYESWIAYGRYSNSSSSHLLKIGSVFDHYEHAIESRIFDNHGLASRKATTSFLKEVDKIKPDLIHLHNIHGYFLNYKILFQYFCERSIPVVWTLHDCWSFTGHCSYFSYCNCNKWLNECNFCPQKQSYPKSIFLDRSNRNFFDKKKAFTSFSNLTIIPVSNWLDQLVAQSFLQRYNHYVVYNGIDTKVFSPSSNVSYIKRKHNIQENEVLLLGVANIWSRRKGLHDFIELSKQLSSRQKIVLIGLTKKQIKTLPNNIIGIERTESVQQLADYYSAADLFLNLTYEDNYPTTNLESISCGTPCLTYRTGGSPESITTETGFVIPQGNFEALLQCIKTVQKNGSQFYSVTCRKHALAHFRAEDRFQEYINLYKNVLKK